MPRIRREIYRNSDKLKQFSLIYHTHCKEIHSHRFVNLIKQNEEEINAIVRRHGNVKQAQTQ